MTITNDAFNLYVLLEISSLTSYALIAIGSKRAVLSAFNYVIMGTIGASFYLLGVGYLYIKTGTLNMSDIREALSTLPQDSPRWPSCSSWSACGSKWLSSRFMDGSPMPTPIPPRPRAP
jgi:NADH:ubiquinone oxidoreductase subunit 2 (subunit N)